MDFKHIIFLFLLLPTGLLAQKKDSLSLVCLLDNAIETPQAKPAANTAPAEMKMVLSSSTDTLVKACTDAVIRTVQRDEEGKWEIVFSHNKYWFWVTGVSTAIVKKNQKVKKGEVIGHLTNGDKIELLLYDFETPIDPNQYLKCGN